VAHTLSAKKRIRQNIKSRARNRWRKDQIKNALRDFEKALHDGDAEQVQQCYRQVCKRLDQVAAKGTIHKNAASRKKARLAVRINKAGL
jgi:small subunit ribosomal protein S20